MSREQTPADGAPEGAEPAHSTAEIRYSTQRDAIPVDDTYRHRMNRQRSPVQESRHKLVREICRGRRGQIARAYRTGQDQLGALCLGLNAAVL
ncbi:hypothetical protein ACFWQ6_06675 [Streptomyces coelicoflavus]|uniref:hypothetical protein n=1 Tax=Streptomyces TaxID=1883 RepID=UPI0036671EA5